MTRGASASTTPAATATAPGDIARAFVAARLAARALAAYPGGVPATLAEGYAIQELAIGLWPDQVAGWKVGRVPSELQAKLGEERIAGPTFMRALRTSAPGESVALPVIAGGFAAVEAEFVYPLARDAPVGKTAWTAAEALELVGALHIGVEFAGSPLPTINDLGSTVVVSSSRAMPSLHDAPTPAKHNRQRFHLASGDPCPDNPGHRSPPNSPISSRTPPTRRRRSPGSSCSPSARPGPTPWASSSSIRSGGCSCSGCPTSWASATAWT